MKSILLVVCFLFGPLAAQGQREWVQWGPLRVYVVGRGRKGDQLDQLRDGREVNSVQDILAQLDTSRIPNATLPVISISIPRTNESITLDCITANNEPGQCKRVQDCFLNAFTTDGRAKNRALLERDVDSSLSCHPKLSYWAQNLAYDAVPSNLYNPDKPFDIRDKLICCEKPRILDIMKIVNITEVKSQALMENFTMLEMETAVPTHMTEMELDAENFTADAFNIMNMTEEMADALPNFEALIAPMMPEIMKMQLNDTTIPDSRPEVIEEHDEVEHTTLPDILESVRTTTFTPPVAEALTGEAPQLLPRRVDGGSISHHKNSSKYIAANGFDTNGRGNYRNDDRKPERKLCIIKPKVECAVNRVGNAKRPEEIHLKNKYSWMATLFVDRQMFCMGSLIDADHILTAAHCFPKNPSSMDFEKVKIGIGYHGERPNITNPYVTRKVSKIIVHEGFNFKTLVNDIAIVKLESSAFNKTSLFDYDDVVDQDFPDPQPKPICFTEATEDLNTSFENAEAILSGWTIPRRRRKTMAQEISIRVWNNEECCAKYGDIPPAGITDEMMCAFTYGKNDCFSRYNTGAPLFILSEKGKRVNAYNHTTPNYIVDRFHGDDEGDYVQFQIGILSWGYGCKDYPPVFTRVNPYFDWIENILSASSS